MTSDSSFFSLDVASCGDLHTFHVGNKRNLHSHLFYCRCCHLYLLHPKLWIAVNDGFVESHGMIINYQQYKIV